MYGGFLEYYFRLQFSAFWSMNDKTSSWEKANFKMYPSFPPKTEIPPEKSYPPSRPPPEKSRIPWQETQVTGNILIPWETLSFWKNIGLPPAIKKRENLKLQGKEKTSLLVKVLTTLKLPRPLWKSLKPPTWKLSISPKKPNTIGKFFNSFEVTRPIKPSPHEKISIPENLTPLIRKLQSSHAHENRNYNHPENISPPPEIFQIPWTNSTPRKWSQPLPKKSQTLPKASPSLKKI